jgi:hypothetical protein
VFVISSYTSFAALKTSYMTLLNFQNFQIICDILIYVRSLYFVKAFVMETGYYIMQTYSCSKAAYLHNVFYFFLQSIFCSFYDRYG